MGNQLLTPEEVAKQLQITLPTLKNWRRKGFIKAISWGPGEGKGARFKYPESEVKRLLQTK